MPHPGRSLMEDIDAIETRWRRALDQYPERPPRQTDHLIEAISMRDDNMPPVAVPKRNTLVCTCGQTFYRGTAHALALAYHGHITRTKGDRP